MRLSKTAKNGLIIAGLAGALLLGLWYFGKLKSVGLSKRYSASTMDIADRAFQRGPQNWGEVQKVSQSEPPPGSWVFEPEDSPFNPSSSQIPDAFGAISSIPNFKSGEQQRANAELPAIQVNDELIELPDYLNSGKKQVIRVHRTLRKAS